MRTTFIVLITLILTTSSLQAQSDQETIEAQALEIKQLKRALNIKEQELKILLITVKNAKQESMLHSTDQHLKFQNVDNITPTRVVVKPSMLSETAIKEIDQGADTNTDTDTLTDNLEKASAQADDVVESTEDSETSSKSEESVQKEIEKLTYMKPSTFTLTKDTHVYPKIYGEAGEIWTEGMRFTSNKRRGSWIQITGKITNAHWKAVTSELWIDESFVKKIR